MELGWRDDHSMVYVLCEEGPHFLEDCDGVKVTKLNDKLAKMLPAIKVGD